jgi:tetratricopeptide (TPR) repeat protein
VACQRGFIWTLAGLLLFTVRLHAQNQTNTTPANNRPPAGGVDERAKVEKLNNTRRNYQIALEELRSYYLEAGDLERAKWAEEELINFHRIAKQAYRLDLDVPPPLLKAEENIPEANEIYRRAMTYKDKGWSSTEYIDNQRRAEILFQQILTKFPQSDKIDDAAYQLGDIYESRAYKQYRRAALYYERCFQWNPNTQFDARIRAARLYDKYLQERSRAVELYKEVTTHETDPKRIAEAQKRITELSGKK